MLERMLTEEEMEAFYNRLNDRDRGMVTIRGFDYEADKDMEAVRKLYEAEGKDMPKDLFGAKYYYKDEIGRRLVKQQLKIIYKIFLRTKERKANIRFMFPMISNLEDVAEITKIKEEVIEELVQDEGFREGIKEEEIKKRASQMQIGAMVESPLAVRNIEQLMKAFDFVSIGTNDLTKSTFEISRDDPRSEKYFNKLNSELLSQVKEVIASGIKNGKPVSICGELARKPLFMCFILYLSESKKMRKKLGFKSAQKYKEAFFKNVSLSISPINVPEYRELLRNMSLQRLRKAFKSWETKSYKELNRDAYRLHKRIIKKIEDRKLVKLFRQEQEAEFLASHSDISKIILLKRRERYIRQAA
jgi:phosphoenolpyruvate-protein kinase (PTS system EI component)